MASPKDNVTKETVGEPQCPSLFAWNVVPPSLLRFSSVVAPKLGGFIDADPYGDPGKKLKREVDIMPAVAKISLYVTPIPETPAREVSLSEWEGDLRRKSRKQTRLSNDDRETIGHGNLVSRGIVRWIKRQMLSQFRHRL